MELNAIYTFEKEHMSKSIDALKRDFQTLRSGKVNISILDNIHVDYYGTPTPLNQVASVMASDAVTITISPWEKKILKDIERAIAEANIGVNPGNDGESVKLYFPPMTVEQRQDSAKHAKAMGEKARVAIRNIRKEANDKIKKLEKDKVLSEDMVKKGEGEVQKITDDFIKTVDELVKQKEAELLKV
ncbi:MAG: ribosome recycling factor [Campylobacteraceae bacterium]|jgi:ribosome recycling factor|nr:ribosome recycling factor [Campylobacteraceae bacterium]